MDVGLDDIILLGMMSWALDDVILVFVTSNGY